MSKIIPHAAARLGDGWALEDIRYTSKRKGPRSTTGAFESQDLLRRLSGAL